MSAARDAVFGAGTADSGARDSLLAKVSWLYDLDAVSQRQSSAKKAGAAGQAVDNVLAAFDWLTT